MQQKLKVVAQSISSLAINIFSVYFVEDFIKLLESSVALDLFGHY